MLRMMSVIIALSCSGIPSGQENYKVACNKAFEAVSIQSGVQKRVDNFEKVVTRAAERDARRYVPNEAIGPIVALYTVAIAKEARISTGSVPYVDSTTLIIREDRAQLRLAWEF